jgi:hypothetical protein
MEERPMPYIATIEWIAIECLVIIIIIALWVSEVFSTWLDRRYLVDAHGAALVT